MYLASASRVRASFVGGVTVAGNAHGGEVTSLPGLVVPSQEGFAANAASAEQEPTETTDKQGAEATVSARPKMTNKYYESELATLQGRLVAMQEWVVATGARIIVVFEGRDTVGKGGTIKRIIERVSPRVFRLVALPAPTERERSQMYVQRYMQHFPAAGQVVIFDRSWYNRAGVGRVMGFCTEEEARRFLHLSPSQPSSLRGRAAGRGEADLEISNGPSERPTTPRKVGLDHRPPGTQIGKFACSGEVS
jgi:hypothetical protein